MELVEVQDLELVLDLAQDTAQVLVLALVQEPVLGPGKVQAQDAAQDMELASDQVQDAVQDMELAVVQAQAQDAAQDMEQV